MALAERGLQAAKRAGGNAWVLVEAGSALPEQVPGERLVVELPRWAACGGVSVQSNLPVIEHW